MEYEAYFKEIRHTSKILLEHLRYFVSASMTDSEGLESAVLRLMKNRAVAQACSAH